MVDSVNPTVPHKTIRELHADWVAADQEYDEFVFGLREQGLGLTEVNKKIMAKYGTLRVAYWNDMIAAELGNQIKEAGGFGKVEVLGPMGIGARVSIHLYQHSGLSDSLDDIVASLTVEPDLSVHEEGYVNPVLSRIDYNTNSHQFAAGTIGQLNGFNFGRIAIDNNATGKDLLEFLEK